MFVGTLTYNMENGTCASSSISRQISLGGVNVCVCVCVYVCVSVCYEPVFSLSAREALDISGLLAVLSIAAIKECCVCHVTY